MALSPNGRAYAWAWGVIEAGVSARASTRQIYDLLYGEGRRLGKTLDRSKLFAGVTELRSLAVKERTAAERFAKASPETGFMPEHAPQTIRGRDLELQAINPEILVRFDMATVHPTRGEETVTHTVKMPWTVGMTVGDVLQTIAEESEAMANKYGVALSGVSNLRPVRI